MTPSKKNLQAVLLFGPPGSGKGTQAELLSEKFGFFHLESSMVLEGWFRNAKEDDFIEIEGKKYYARDERKLWETGVLMSPPIVAYLMREKIHAVHDAGNSLVTSGALRTLYEAEQLYPLLKELYKKENIRIIRLQLNEEQSVYRNSHRRICELMRHPVLYREETANLIMCPLDGSKLLKREGLDDAETIKTRLKEYEARTLSSLDYLEKTVGLRIVQVNGNQSVAEVFQNVSDAV